MLQTRTTLSLIIRTYFLRKVKIAFLRKKKPHYGFLEQTAAERLEHGCPRFVRSWGPERPPAAAWLTKPPSCASSSVSPAAWCRRRSVSADQHCSR